MLFVVGSDIILRVNNDRRQVGQLGQTAVIPFARIAPELQGGDLVLALVVGLAVTHIPETARAVHSGVVHLVRLRRPVVHVER